MIEAVESAVLTAKTLEIKRIDVSHEQFYRNTGNRSMWLLTFVKKGKVGRLAVLSNQKPMLAEAVLLSLKMSNSFNLDGIKKALGVTACNRVVAAMNDGSAPDYVQDQSISAEGDRDNVRRVRKTDNRDAYFEI